MGMPISVLALLLNVALDCFTAPDVVEVAQEGFLDEDRLRSNAGFLLGWIAAQTFPLSARTERTIF
jgi:hypothetical protein